MKQNNNKQKHLNPLKQVPNYRRSHKQIRALGLILALLLLSPVVLPAEAVRLNSGQIIEGKIVDEDEKVLLLETHRGTISIRKKDILEVERGEQQQILRPKRDTNEPWALAAMSFIPFYSGMFQLEEQSYGIPFAIANGLAALQYYNHSSRYVAPDGFHLDSGPGDDLVNLVGVRIAAENLATVCPGNSACAFGLVSYSINTIAYNLFADKKEVRTWFLGKGSSTLQHSDNMLRTSASVYFISSLLNALLSYSYAVGDGPLDMLLGDAAPNADKPVFFVAIPEAKGYKFGLTIAF